jgi:hypothetical protein
MSLTAARRDGDRMRTRSLEAGELAWLAVLPCALVVVLAVVVLGPRLGDALFGPAGDRFWPEALLTPEPVEHARYALALLGPPLAAALVVAGARGRVRLRPGAARVAIAAAQLATLAVLALALLSQYDVLFRSHTLAEPRQRIFSRCSCARRAPSASYACCSAARSSRPGCRPPSTRRRRSATRRPTT